MSRRRDAARGAGEHQLLPSNSVADLRSALLRWFRRAARDLPWRRTSDTYAIWVSEVMLQQTRAATVIPYFERFLRRLPTVEALANADESLLRELWAGLGYYSRVRNLQRAAQQLVRDARGMPRGAEQWRQLPGVGRYTAAAVASIGLGERVAVLDGNVKRVLARLLGERRCIDDAAVVEDLWTQAERLLHPRAPGAFNQAMMELGATICTPRSPRCAECPLAAHCAAQREGLQRQIPLRRAKRPPRVAEQTAVAVVDAGRCLLVRRGDGPLSGAWTLPATPLHANAVEEVAEIVWRQTGVRVRPGADLGQVRHAFSHIALTVRVVAAGVVRPVRRLTPEARWVSLRELRQTASSTLDRKLFAVALGDEAGADCPASGGRGRLTAL